MTIGLPPLQLLIANFKYTGSDYDADMKAIAADEETQRWWKVTDGMQESFEAGATGSGQEVPWWTVSRFVSIGLQILRTLGRVWKRSSGSKGLPLDLFVDLLALRFIHGCQEDIQAKPQRAVVSQSFRWPSQIYFCRQH